MCGLEISKDFQSQSLVLTGRRWVGAGADLPRRTRAGQGKGLGETGLQRRQPVYGAERGGTWGCSCPGTLSEAQYSTWRAGASSSHQWGAELGWGVARSRGSFWHQVWWWAPAWVLPTTPWWECTATVPKALLGPEGRGRDRAPGT